MDTEKFGTLRWYCHLVVSSDEALHDTSAEGVVDWAEDVSAT